MLAQITFYGLVLFLHVAAVVVAFGVTFTYAPVFSVTRKGYERHLPYLHHIQVRAVTLVANALVLLVIFLMVTKP